MRFKRLLACLRHHDAVNLFRCLLKCKEQDAAVIPTFVIKKEAKKKEVSSDKYSLQVSTVRSSKLVSLSDERRTEDERRALELLG